jgi:hypothetical protein
MNVPRVNPDRPSKFFFILTASLVLASLAIVGCATIPNRPEHPSFEGHAATKRKDGVTVSVAVLTDDEADQYFGCPLADQGIQAVWLKVTNDNEFPLGLLSRTMDPEYFSPMEVAFLNHRMFSDGWNRELDEYFLRSQFPAYVEPGTTDSGFVFTSRTEGAKFVNVELWQGEGMTREGFFMKLPSGGFDFQEADVGKMYSPNELKAVNILQLRDALEKLPCCAADKSGNKNGDPVNFVMIGEEDAVLGALTQQGWDPTQTIGGQSVRKTIAAFLFGGRYRHSPVSRLFYFGRGQDLALQKVRSTIHQRNHLRLWRAPYTHQGRDVWMGQISRDIGVRFTWESPILVTHKIDPEVDDARDYLVQDMIASDFLEAMSYVEGVGGTMRSAPRHNLTGDPYFTDGLRAVMFISTTPVPSNRINLIDWGEPLPTD